MIKKLNILTGLFDDKIYTLVDNDNLEIEVTSKNYGNSYVAVVKKENETSKIALRDNKFEIPKTFLTYGEICVKIIAIRNGETIKEFNCENLIVKEIDTKIVAIPELEQFKSDCNKKLNEVIAKQTEIIGKMAELEQRLCDVENNFDPTVI